MPVREGSESADASCTPNKKERQTNEGEVGTFMVAKANRVEPKSTEAPGFIEVTR
jgi:hypothetical protein